MSHRSKRDHKECGWSRVERYQGKRKPRCNDGDGCKRCWDKYHIMNNRGGHDDRPPGIPGSTFGNVKRRKRAGAKHAH
jgi:hypothetical protein